MAPVRAGNETEVTAARAVGGQLATTSRLHTWWLVTFRQYRVCGKTMAPQEGVFRRVRYVTTWFLEDAK